MKYNFIIKEGQNGVLLSLAKLIDKLHFEHVRFWALRNIESMGCLPFGLYNQEFEVLTKCFSAGLVVNNTDFERLINCDFQIIGGEIDVYLSNSSDPVVKIECCDSSFWVISTHSLQIANDLISRGFEIDPGVNL